MQRPTEIQAGIFITLGIILFVAVIWLLGQERQIFESQQEYIATFKDVQGLSDGAAIRLSGINIGRVKKIAFSQNQSDPAVYVTLLINDKYFDRIREDSLASIETQGLLGDKIISIRSEGSGNVLGPGSTVRSVEPADIAQVLNKAGQVVDNTVKISQVLSEFLGELKTDTIKGVSESSQLLAEILKEVKDGNGVANALIYSKEKNGSKIVHNLEEVTANVATITSDLKKNDGLLNALIYDPKGKQTLTSLNVAAENLASTAQEIAKIAKEVETGNGLMHSMIYNKAPEGLDDIVKKLNATADNLQKASKALAEGNGTLGALLYDDQLYNNVVEITDGAKRSYLLKEAIKSSLESKK